MTSARNNSIIDNIEIWGEMFVDIRAYRLQLKRRGLIMNEVYVGTKLGLWIYKFQMRKWKITIID